MAFGKDLKDRHLFPRSNKTRQLSSFGSNSRGFVYKNPFAGSKGCGDFSVVAAEEKAVIALHLTVCIGEDPEVVPMGFESSGPVKDLRILPTDPQERLPGKDLLFLPPKKVFVFLQKLPKGGAPPPGIPLENSAGQGMERMILVLTVNVGK